MKFSARRAASGRHYALFWSAVALFCVVLLSLFSARPQASKHGQQMHEQQEA